MQASKLSLAELLKIEGNIEHYHIPKYQREYVWGKTEWETLINDINENDPDYFIGSVIVVAYSDARPGAEKIYQVVDGQQRLTTLTLLLSAIYRKFKIIESAIDRDDEDLVSELQVKLNSIQRKLIYRKKSAYNDEPGGFMDNKQVCFLRVQPSTQNNNLADYKYIFKECGLLKDADTPKNFGNRRFARAYQYFLEEIPDAQEDLESLLEKINRLVFIHIAVGTQADAFVLFETLNNRGVDLSPIDIIKNSLLAEMEKQHQINIDESFQRWQELLVLIPDFDSQLRFLRQYYNAFKIDPEIKHEKVTKATKTTVLTVYERLIKKNPDFIFNDLIVKAKFYSNLIGITSTDYNGLNQKIEELNKVGAAASYTLLMYLLQNKEHLEDDGVLVKLVDFLIKYYLRRNITDTPNTRDLDSINIDIVERCHQSIISGAKLSADFIISLHLNNAKAKPAGIEVFKHWLSDAIYENNAGMTRYLLWKIDSIYHTREYAPDLWRRNENNNTFIWTIEHVFPEGKNIPETWVKMMANGDRKSAERIQEECVHKLGNLTLSAYNSNLSNKSFEEKRNLNTRRVGAEDVKIGYLNGLGLNKFNYQVNNELVSLAETKIWNQSHIEARTIQMVEKIIELFKFDGEG
jgi:uncharacterized protein with ParB-like and HNH nuclease domain